MDTQQIYELFEARRKELDLSQSQLGMLALGQPNSSVIQAIKRGSSPSALKLEAICNALGLEFYIGPPRQDRPNIEVLEHVPDQSNELSPSPRNLVLLSKEQNNTPYSFSLVQRYDVSLSAGHGTDGANAAALAPVAFRKDWLSNRGLIAEKCVVCGVRGDSMEPLLWDGDLVLLDRRERPLKNGEVYGVVDVAGDILIKRVEKVDDGIVLRSDNPRGPTTIRFGEDANSIRIIGSLVWSGHNFEKFAATHRKKEIPPQMFEMSWAD